MLSRRRVKRRRRAAPDPESPLLWGCWMGPEDDSGFWAGCSGGVITWDGGNREKGLAYAEEAGGTFAPYLTMGHVMSTLGQAMKKALGSVPAPVRKALSKQIDQVI